MSSFLVISIIIVYLSAIFYVAFWAEKNSKSKWVNNPYVYTLSLAVYCTAWTYYGSVGLAATSGLKFLTIYLGPIIIIPSWIILMKKIIKISKGNKISSLADFISLRYGNDRFLGALVTIICVLAIVPYISLQLKAISETFNVITNHTIFVNTIINDTTFYIAILLGIFAAFFGTQHTDATERHKGIITAVALESVIKLVFFLAIGIYVTFYLFNGPSDIYNQVSLLPNFESQKSINGLQGGFNWFFLSILSMIAIMLLPRQFQAAVVENEREKYLKKAAWLFPLYLLLFNVFVIFIAWGGNIVFHNQGVEPDLFTLMLPLKSNHEFLALIVFLGGFSAAISMVVLSSLALSTMLSNNLIIPYGFLQKFSKGESEQNMESIKNIRRISIFLLIIMAYFFYKSFTLDRSLVSIGLISFVVIAQLAPAFFGGLFWRRGSSIGAKFGIIIGFLITFYTLIFPFIIDSLIINSSFVNEGLFGIHFLKPYELFGLSIFEPVPQAFFWSLFLNILVYVFVSVYNIGTYRERNFAEMFVDNSKYASLHEDAYVWKGEAYVKDLKNILNRFLGINRTERALNLFFMKYKLDKNSQFADARLVNFSEKLLTGSIGSASSRILISSVIKEEEISLTEVLNILEETKKAKDSNKELQERDKQKDEFLDTVAHELKTPITSIRALSEILLDNDDVDFETKNKFLSSILNESDRVNRLINNILDLEKLASGKEKLALKKNSIKNTIEKSIDSVRQLALKKEIKIIDEKVKDANFLFDEDRIQQVIINLLSNAIKFSPPKKGKIVLKTKINKYTVDVLIEDNGKGIADNDLDSIFDKFYQAKNQTILKPKGSGLGLAISKQIVESHNGKIWAKNVKPNGARLTFSLPINKN
ncbi:ATP-binding protein [Lutibacter sp.]|uniref:ATP-binding protein n=1 Tax=Lutibacter sp. TaxID=1925666 RepID=UPI0025BABCD2|nr:ATP-binding protein [Lutibacter sp.]MCF6182321.1 ATP-binding protein [Lutibacter sp.]